MGDTRIAYVISAIIAIPTIIYPVSIVLTFYSFLILAINEQLFYYVSSSTGKNHADKALTPMVIKITDHPPDKLDNTGKYVNA